MRASSLALAAVVALGVYVRLLPLSLDGVVPYAARHAPPEQREELAAELRAERQYTDARGRPHAYLGDWDSYLWLRHARNYLRHGTTCDAVRDGECRDELAHAPVGREMLYARSIHIAAIVATHRLLTLFDPDWPLPASSYAVQVVAGAAAAIPAYAIAAELAGPVAGIFAAVALATNRVFLSRTLGSDNDVWNVLLPLLAVWLVSLALAATRSRGRMLWTLAAAAVMAVYAASWSGWRFTHVVLLAALAGALGLHALRAMLHRRDRERARERVREIATILAVYFVACGVLGWLAGSTTAYLEPLVDFLHSAAANSPPAAPALQAYWPNVFSTVSELVRPGLDGVIDLLDGPVVFFCAWLGLLLVLTRRYGWRWWHFAILLGGNVVYRFLVRTGGLSAYQVTALLFVPLAAALVAWATAGSENEQVSGKPRAKRKKAGRDRQRSSAPPRDVDLDGGIPADVHLEAGLLVVVWFLAATVMSYGAVRFTILLVAPFAIALGVLAGRLFEWTTALVKTLVPRASLPASALLVAVIGAMAFPIVSAGYQRARSYLPAIDDAWVDTFERIRDETPPGSIVSAWWDYGHWAKYYAERPTMADGGSLRTHIPYWEARAFYTDDEKHAVGILRMLACGSAAAGYPEEAASADGKLVGYGVEPLVAEAIVDALAASTREDADRLLAGLGLTAHARDDVLASTHCRPAPTYLAVSTEQVNSPAWIEIGSWDFRRAWLLREGRALPQSRALETLTGPLHYPPSEARSLLAEASAIESPEAERAFTSPARGYVTAAWRPCHASDPPGALVCPLHDPILMPGSPEPATIDQVHYVSNAAYQTSVHVTSSDPAAYDAAGSTLRPGLVIVAGKDGLEETQIPESRARDLAVLVDEANAQVAIGSRVALRSTLTKLVFLDGRYSRRFEKFGEHDTLDGKRVTTWRVRWDED